MRAVVHDGPAQVSVKDLPDVRIQQPTDVLVRITTTNLCGSDLHMYEGHTEHLTTHVMSPDDGPTGYRMFTEEDGCVRAVVTTRG